GNSIFLITLASFFPIYVNTTTGAAQISPLILRAGHMLGAKGGKFFTTIILHAAFPSILIGLRLGLGIAWAYLVLGEITGVSQGLGAVMMDARMLGNTEMILSSMLAIAILGRISDLLLVKICNIFYPYQARQEQENS
ncbi:MAG: ABC transporter permease subunit, partial [Clostridiales bacterium]